MTQRVAISDEQAQQMMAKQEQQQQQQAAMDEQRESMLRAFVSAEGRERLKRIEQVKPERARMVEVAIIQAVRGGKLQAPVSDGTVREFLQQVVENGGGEGAGNGPKISVIRKRSDDDW
uniref:Double-stranded DNA-binding domain-containing protein n=1 Tax=Neobodo designis TaxID=312471 RepID=A0A7S1LMQ4_NEODS|mmetsp:Transcript_25118/g.77615  ORF Transcript_25118/g.77615 Transcript_25118/m.77615 type:complete len:119 (+) Transcript_25118:95-451(+)|eukprot:CAMPEP_0174850658 /NCGR_PEP_ID=MMETSP1114-20130205/20598_1 /TAXON_ID=312471 /ORGANISM="Neobodo designis, Strain CCAP 1951/1" /LENGTH=118 /DNA_ID=CAMNT_0016085131 /DNA_START=95 /DNA_END=451 /DNA_ORIENTATION=+